MLELDFAFPSTSPTILFLGAHCDDVEIGCGGTAMTLIRRFPRAKIHWVVLSSGEERAREAQRAATLVLGPDANLNLVIADFRISYFPAELAAIKDFFEELKEVSPDLIFSHFKNDFHQDHRVVAELTWNTFRDHTILEYEIPKYDGGLGSPSVFTPLSSQIVDRKIDILMDVYGSQRSKSWFTPDTFRGIMRLRGVESNSSSGFAESFYARKLRLAGPNAE